MKHGSIKLISYLIGFSLLELLIVIAIIGILAVGAFVALDPGERLRDSRDATRWTDVTAILDGAKVDQVDNGGSYLAAIQNATASNNYMIGTDTSGCNVTCDQTIASVACIDLAGLVNEGYLASIPKSPNGASTWTAGRTGYYFNRATFTVKVGACESEGTGLTDISVQR